MHPTPQPDPHPSPVCVVGLVGGIASGKSTVTKILAELGARVIDADAYAREALTQPDNIDRIREMFGSEVIGPDGQVNRASLATLVFGSDPAATARRKQLEVLIHPQVRRRTEEMLAIIQAGVEKNRTRPAVQTPSMSATTATTQPPLKRTLIVLDVPLLLEAGWDSRCDRILYIDTPTELRCARALARGWTDTQWQEREAAQVSLEEKRRRATDVVLNDGSIETLRHRLGELASKWSD